MEVIGNRLGRFQDALCPNCCACQFASLLLSVLVCVCVWPGLLLKRFMKWGGEKKRQTEGRWQSVTVVRADKVTKALVAFWPSEILCLCCFVVFVCFCSIVAVVRADKVTNTIVVLPILDLTTRTPPHPCSLSSGSPVHNTPLSILS